MRALETVNGFGFRRVFGLFWPLFDSFCGGSIRKLIQPPQKEVENRLKRTEKSTETKSVNSLLDRIGVLHEEDKAEVQSKLKEVLGLRD